MSKQMTDDELGTNGQPHRLLFVVATSLFIRHSDFVIWLRVPKLARDIDLFLPIFFLWRGWICLRSRSVSPRLRGLTFT